MPCRGKHPAWCLCLVCSACFSCAVPCSALPCAFEPCPSRPADQEALRTAFINVDKEGKGDITESQFEEALRQAGVELVRHQGVSLYRHLAGHAGTAAVRVEHFLQVGCYSVLWQHMADQGLW